MPEEEYPANNFSRPKPSKEPAKKQVARVTTGAVVQRKKPLRRRFAETFQGDDNQGVMDYLVFDVAIPAAKDMFFDLITQGAERKLFGEVRSHRRRGGSTWGTAMPHTQYSKVSRNSREERPSLSRRARSQHTFDEIFLETRAEAVEVLRALDGLIEQFECASVRDLYDLVDLPASWQDEKFGWTDLRNASVSHVGRQYMLNLPRTEPLD